MNNKVSIEFEVVNGVVKIGKFEGDSTGFLMVAASLVHAIAKFENKRTKDVISTLINAVAFAENASNETIEKMKKMMEE